MLDEWFMAETRAETMQQEREEVYAALQYAASFHCVVEQWKDCEELKRKLKEKWIFVDRKKGNEASNRVGVRKQKRYRCVQMHEDARKMYRTKILVEKFGKWGRQHLGGHDLIRRMDRQGEVLNTV